MLNRQNLLSVTKVICWQTLRTLHPPVGLTLYMGMYYMEKLLDVKKYLIDHYCMCDVLILSRTSCSSFGTIGCYWLSVHYRTSLKISFLNPALFSTDNLKLDRITSKIKWKIHISSFKDAYLKSYKMQLRVLYFISCCFTSADII